MKKVYSVALILLALWMPSVNAQCPPPGGFAVPYILPGGSCQVIAFNMPSNALIRVLNGAGVDITLRNPDNSFPMTDALGTAAPFYNCNSTPAQVVTLGPGKVCFANVAAPINLPIKVKNFTAHAQSDNSVLLRWASVFEITSHKYVIQKSVDGRTFTDIGNLQAAGNSVQTISYSFSDRQLTNSGAYYRLKLVDLDGSFTYTKIIYINNGQVSLGQLSVFPNPFRSEVQLKGISSSDVNRKNVKIYNAMGMEVNYRVLGGNAITIDPALPKGVYIIRVKGEAFKLFKE
ncbi:MAG: T9SS type A sorting domain-containing protein [Chitinophagaceae bacterium]|nr:T9SS type A sorting domain-containing protein [Chitinophagaceae bacterium]